MSFTPTTWVNGSAPGISAEQLNRIEQGIEDLDLATVSTPVTATAAVISLPSTTFEGKVNVVTKGNTVTQLVDSGVACVNWTITGAGTTKGATGIHLVQDIGNDSAFVNVNAKAGQQYTLIYRVTATDLDSTFVLSSVSITGAIITLTKTIGWNKVLVTASDPIVDNELTLLCTSGNTNGKYINFTDVMLLKGDWTTGTNNDLTNQYIGYGTKSTFKDGGRVTTTNKNRFDGKWELGSMATDTGLNEDSTSVIRTKNFIPIKSGTAYIISLDGVAQVFATYQYDINRVFIVDTRTTTSTFTANNNAVYVKCARTVTGLTLKHQLEVGVAATAYTVPNPTQAYIPLSTNGLISVGSVKDEIDVNTGVKKQNNETAGISSTIYASLDKTTYTNVDAIRTTSFALAKAGMVIVDGFTDYWNSAGAELTEIAAADIDLAASVGKYYFHVDKTIWIFVTPDTYVDIAAARTGLGTSTLNYQLLAPVVTEIEGMEQLMSGPSGSLIWETAVKFEAKPVVGVITIPSGWANILNVESVKQITMNADGSLTYGSSIAPVSNTTTTLTLTTYDDTKFYEIVYLYDSALSTIPDTTYSYPTNVRGEIDSIGDMASQTAENLDDLNDFTITQLIALNSVWKYWTPALTWTTATPASVTTVARYITIGNTCFFNFMVTSADGNAATQLSISLPVAAKDNNSLTSFTAQELVDTTWSNPLAYLDDDTGGITFRIFSTATDTKTVTVVVTGQYEVSVA